MLFPYKSQLRRWYNTKHFPAESFPSVDIAAAWSRPEIATGWLTLIAAAFCVLLPNLSYPLIEPDETRYAQIAIEMNQSRDWITPTLDGAPYLDKPPLVYWLTATSFRWFGIHQAAARLPSMVSAFLTIMVVFSLGSKIVGRRAAWLGAMSLVLCGGFVLAGRFLILDSMLAFFTTLCVLSGYIAVRHVDHRWAWWIFSGVACALGVLTKGPVALVLCAPPLAVSGWLRADQTRVRALHWAAFVLPMIAVCVPWYVAVMKLNPEFGGYFFGEHNLERFTKGSNHPQPFWFYVPILFASMFPASLLLPSMGVFVASRSEQKRQLRSKDLGFLSCASVWILVFFSAASCKLPTYILPAIPLVSLMLGVMIDQTVLRPELSNRITDFLKPFPQRASLILVLATLAIGGTDAWLIGLSWITVWVVMTCIAVTVLVGCYWNRPIAFARPGWLATTVLAVAVLTLASTRLLPTIAKSRSLYVKAAEAAQLHPDATVVFLIEKSHSVQMQLDANRVVYFPNHMRDEFVCFMSSLPDAIVITDDQSIDATERSIETTHDLVNLYGHRHLYFAKRIEGNRVDVATNRLPERR